jgi:ABC-type phosphate transport system substrate-binding protein
MSIKLRALMGVSALAAFAMAGAANAGDIWGGGSTLIAPYHDQMACAYGQPAWPSTPDFVTPPGAAFALPAPPPGGCTNTTSNAVHYALTGSGGGINGIYSHDRARYGVTSIPAWATGDVQYGLSETGMLAGDVTIFNNGGTTSSGIVLSATPGAGQYAIPKTRYGALTQFPVAIAPVALAYDPTYKKVNVGGTVTSYNFRVDPAFARATGGLRLDQATYCKIVNGQITDWNDPAITALNNNTSLKDPADTGTFSVPIELVGRAESSGTTTVTTRHFANACASLSGNAFTAVAGTSTLPAAVQGPLVGNTPVAGKFTRATGSANVAAYVDFTDTPATGQTIVRGRLGYVGADYALPAASANGLTYTLYTADLKNAAGAYREPSSANATTAFSGNRPPQTATGATGNYDTTQTLWGVRTSPEDWVRVSPSSGSATLANPTPAQAYPIIATVNYLGYTCYATAAKTGSVRTSAVSGSPSGYVNYWFTRDDILTNAGLAPLPAAWKNAIINTFLTPVTATLPLNLFIDTVGTNGTADPDNSTCASLPGA